MSLNHPPLHLLVPPTQLPHHAHPFPRPRKSTPSLTIVHMCHLPTQPRQQLGWCVCFVVPMCPPTHPPMGPTPTPTPIMTMSTQQQHAQTFPFLLVTPQIGNNSGRLPEWGWQGNTAIPHCILLHRQTNSGCAGVSQWLCWWATATGVGGNGRVAAQKPKVLHALHAQMAATVSSNTKCVRCWSPVRQVHRPGRCYSIMVGGTSGWRGWAGGWHGWVGG